MTLMIYSAPVGSDAATALASLVGLSAGVGL